MEYWFIVLSLCSDRTTQQDDILHLWLAHTLLYKENLCKNYLRAYIFSNVFLNIQRYSNPLLKPVSCQHAGCFPRQLWADLTLSSPHLSGERFERFSGNPFIDYLETDIFCKICNFTLKCICMGFASHCHIWKKTPGADRPWGWTRRGASVEGRKLNGDSFSFLLLHNKLA